MRRSLPVFIVLLGVSLQVFGSIHSEAERILHATRDTRYQHKTHVDERRGVFYVDCSGLVDYIVPRVSPAAYAEMKEYTQQGPRPLARDLVAFFLALGHPASDRWLGVRHVQAIRAGDIIAWLTPDDSESDNTGHTVVARSPARRNSERPGEWLVTVIDSTSSGHGPDDPRRKEGPNGVGSGTIGLVADADGRPYAYRWSGKTSKLSHNTTFGIGRLR